MSHSAVSATATIEFDALLPGVGTDDITIDFNNAIEGQTRMFERIIEVGTGLFEEVVDLLGWEMLFVRNDHDEDLEFCYRDTLIGDSFSVLIPAGKWHVVFDVGFEADDAGATGVQQSGNTLDSCVARFNTTPGKITILAYESEKGA